MNEPIFYEEDGKIDTSSGAVKAIQSVVEVDNTFTRFTCMMRFRGHGENWLVKNQLRREKIEEIELQGILFALGVEFIEVMAEQFVEVQVI